MVVILGKSASGKDTIVNKLLDKGYKKLVTYTTRPMRKSEIQDVTYHFIDEEEFKNKINNNFFAEWRVYNTKHGEWYYGSAVEDYKNSDDNTLVILNPQGYYDVCEQLEHSPKSIYICADKGTRLIRLQGRNDLAESLRRMEFDEKDFEGIVNMTDYTIMNNIDTDIEYVVDLVDKICKGEINNEREDLN